MRQYDKIKAGEAYMHAFMRICRYPWLAIAALFLLVPAGARPQAANLIISGRCRRFGRPGPPPAPLQHPHRRTPGHHLPPRRSLLPEALAKLDYFLRDHNTNEVRHFDPRLYDILSDLTASVGHPERRDRHRLRLPHFLYQRISARPHHRSRQEQPAHSSGSD